MGAPNCGWLKMLKKSALDFSEKRSLSLNILCKVKSTCEALKPRRALRPRSPWPLVGTVNAALLMIFPPGAVGSERYKGTPGTTFGRCTLLAPETRVPGKGFFPVTTFTGGALRAYTIVFTDQFCRIGFAHPLCGPSMYQETAPAKVCRIS